jgi:hypothetical protein
LLAAVTTATLSVSSRSTLTVPAATGGCPPARAEHRTRLRGGPTDVRGASGMSSIWPRLARYEQCGATCDTVHAHTQVLGKLAAVLAPPEPQLQHAALRLTGVVLWNTRGRQVQLVTNGFCARRGAACETCRSLAVA